MGMLFGWFYLSIYLSISVCLYISFGGDVMVKAMACEIVVREFVLQSRYYVHFQASTLN